MTLTLHPDRWLDLIETRGLPLTFTVGAAYVLTSTLIGVQGSAGLGPVGTGLTLLALLSGVLNAVMALVVYPWLFALLSRALGMPSGTYEVRSCAALSLVPWILGALLGLMTGQAGLIALLMSAVSAGTFVYALSLTLREPLSVTLKHTLIVWLLLAAGILAVAAVISALR